MKNYSELRIAHICDIHIDKEGINPRGYPVRENFLQILSDVKEQEPNLLVLGGDLCSEVGELAIYSWIKDQLDTLDTPYLVQPGNHD
jgi:Icc protein